METNYVWDQFYKNSETISTESFMNEQVKYIP